MASEASLVYNILGKIKPFLNDESDVSYREVAADIAIQRALLIRNELNKKRTIDSDLITDLGCVPVMPVDPAECCDVSTGCKIMRTVNKIPSNVELHNDDTITRVGPVNKTLKKFNKTTMEASKYVGSGKYATKDVFFYKHNGYIYLVSKSDKTKFMEHINVNLILEDPADASSFVNCDTGESCFSSEGNYPMKTWMFTYIQGTLVNSYAQRYNIPADLVNNDSDESATKAQAK